MEYSAGRKHASGERGRARSSSDVPARYGARPGRTTTCITRDSAASIPGGRCAGGQHPYAEGALRCSTGGSARVTRLRHERRRRLSLRGARVPRRPGGVPGKEVERSSGNGRPTSSMRPSPANRRLQPSRWRERFGGQLVAARERGHDEPDEYRDRIGPRTWPTSYGTPRASDARHSKTARAGADAAASSRAPRAP